MEISFRECFSSEIFKGYFRVDLHEDTLKKAIHTIYSQDSFDNIHKLITLLNKKIIEDNVDDELKILICNVVSLTLCWMLYFPQKYYPMDEMVNLINFSQDSDMFEFLHDIHRKDTISKTEENFYLFFKNVDYEFFEEVVEDLEQDTYFFREYHIPFIFLSIKYQKPFIKYLLSEFYILEDSKIDFEKNISENTFHGRSDIYNDDKNRCLYEILLSKCLVCRNYEALDYLTNLSENREAFLSIYLYSELIMNGDFYHPFDILRINQNIELSNLIVNFLLDAIKKTENIVLDTENKYIVDNFYFEIFNSDKNLLSILNNYLQVSNYYNILH